VKLSDVTDTVLTHLQADPFLAGLEIIANTQADHNQRLEGALRETGLVLVVVQASGQSPNRDGALLALENEVVVSVLENPARNTTGKQCLEVAERVLDTLHQASWASERGLRNTFRVDTPAYEAGPLDSGLIIYFCNFLVKSAP